MSERCTRCNTDAPGYYVEVAGLGLRCGSCEAAWRDVLAKWRGAAPSTKPEPKSSTEVPGASQGVLL